MPGLFSKRSRSVSTSRPTTPISSSAQSAAAQAFLASRASQTHLSSSAAAAALRTMTPPPTTVGDLQTKRMINRQGSNASLSNAPRGRSTGNIPRRSSSASMTERTFRGSSPGRPATSSGTMQINKQTGNAPPVPAVPEEYVDIPPIPATSHIKSSSIDNLRPTAGKTSMGRGQSMDRLRDASNKDAIRTDAKRLPSLQGSSQLERSDSNGSINFSYPRGTRPNSPPPRSPVVSEHQRPSSPLRNGITQAEADDIRYEVTSVSQKPVKKKTKKLAPQTVEGSHLHDGTMGGKPKATPLEPDPVAEQRRAKTSTNVTTPKAKKKAALSGQASHFPPSPTSPVATSPDSDSDVSTDQQDRRSKRASGALGKQPSVVREDWEGEQEQHGKSISTDTARSAHARKQATEANMSRKIEEPSPTTKVTSSTTSLQLGATHDERSVSRSPSRSTRFSPRLSTDITASGKHEPPGRSVSPAKSALKHHSPSPQSNRRAAGDHEHVRDSSLSPSEATDGSEAGSRRKKAAHVSFDPKPAVVGTAAEPTVSETPVLASPQYKSGKTWLTFNDTMNNDSSEHMGNRPQLPTFGSVRKGRRDDPAQLPATAVAGLSGLSSSRSSSTSSITSVDSPTTKNTSVSSDHAIGGVLVQEAKNKTSAAQKGPNSPLPPEVTSVEGTGFNSDSDSESSDDEADVSKFSNVKTDELDEKMKPGDAPPVDSVVPVIAVQPATPGQDESKPTDQWLVDVPGGFPTTSTQPSSSSDADAGQAQATASSTSGYTSPTPAAPRVASPTSDAQDESASDNDSIYSDAAEDLSDLEGDGFGSIDAVVHSPVSSPTNRAAEKPDKSLGTIQEDEDLSDEADTSSSWKQTQSRWSDIAKNPKHTSLQPAAEIVETPTQTEPRKKKRKEQRIEAQPIEQPITPPYAITTSQDSPYRAPNQSSAYPTLGDTSNRASQQKGFRKSLRDQQTELPASSQKMRSSLRNSQDGMGPKSMRTSMRSSVQSQPQTANRPSTEISSYNRPASPQIPSLPSKVANTAMTAPRRPVIPVSADSDSESSFKRSRRSKKKSDTGAYTMRRSMRSTPGPRAEDRGSMGRDFRSLSPVERRPLSPSMGQSTMRTTLRSSMDSGTPTLRSQKEPSKRTSFFGRNKSPKPQAVTTSSSRMKSRFADSDDEDDARPVVHKSRFADSSDEEAEPISFRPVRGIPRGKDDADSTDLDDSSDEETNKKTKKGLTSPKKLQIQPSSPAPAASTEPVSPSSPITKKKRGFLGIFKKSKDEPPKPDANETVTARNRVDDQAAQVTEEKDLTTNLGFSTDVEREAMIAETQKKLEAQRARPTSPFRRPKSPIGKLQRRITPQRVMSDTWPLPPKLPASEAERPSTADAITNGSPSRPGMGERLPTNETVSTSAGPAAAYGRTGKKKKFGLLRKAFGLKD